MNNVNNVNQQYVNNFNNNLNNLNDIQFNQHIQNQINNRNRIINNNINNNNQDFTHLRYNDLNDGTNMMIDFLNQLQRDDVININQIHEIINWFHNLSSTSNLMENGLYQWRILDNVLLNIGYDFNDNIWPDEFRHFTDNMYNIYAQRG